MHCTKVGQCQITGGTQRQADDLLKAHSQVEQRRIAMGLRDQRNSKRQAAHFRTMSKDSKKADLLPQGVEKDASVVLAVGE